MKNARLPSSASTSTTPTLPLLEVGGFSVIWFSTVGPVLVEAVLEVLLAPLPWELPPLLSSTRATITAAAITATTTAPPSRELGSERAGAALASGGPADADRSCRRCGAGALGGISGRLDAASGASSAAISRAQARPGSEPARKVRVRRRSPTLACWPSR